MDIGCWMDIGWLEKAELKPTQPSLAGAWLSLAIKQRNANNSKNIAPYYFLTLKPYCVPARAM